MFRGELEHGVWWTLKCCSIVCMGGRGLVYGLWVHIQQYKMSSRDPRVSGGGGGGGGKRDPHMTTLATTN